MSLNNVRALGDDRPWKDEVERELGLIRDALKFGKITLRASATSGGGGGGGGGADLSAITATLPATYDGATYVIGIDEDAFDHISNLNYAQFDVTTAAGNAVGRLLWDDTHGTLSFGLKGGLVDLQIGQEQVVRVRNATAGTLTKGTVCYFNGSDGTNFNVEKAIATGDSTSAQTMGVLAEELNTSSTQHGFITTFGLVEGVDLSYISGLAAGDQLYLDGTTAGRMTKTKPSAPIHLVYVGICLSAGGGGSNSTIFVKVQNGYELHEIHDVKITGPVANNEVLAYTSATDLWENKTAAEAGIISTSDVGTVTNTMLAGSIANSKLINSSVTVAGQTVALGGSTGVSLDNLSDVVIATPATDQVLKYDGTNWVNAASPGGGGGTVTSITAGTGLSASPSSPITTSGTLNVTDAALNPSGMVTPFAGSSAPSGWLLCDGSAVSRTTYATLFGVVSTTYGVGDGSTTFNLPNLQGEVPAGRQPATSLGTATISIATPAVVTDTGHGLADGQLIYFTTTGALPTGVVANTRYYVRNATVNTFNISATPTGAAINTSGTQSGTHTLFSADFADLGFSSGSVNETLTIAQTASHTHAPGALTRFHGGNTSTSRTRFAAGTSGGFAFQSGTQSDLAESATTAATGGGVAHNNLQPYIVLNYIIKT